MFVAECKALPKSSLCACRFHVPLGCSSDTCGCPNHILLGSVVTPSGRPLSGARVSLRTRPGTIATSGTHGTFQVPGVCAGSKASVSAQMNGFSAGTAQAHANSSNTATVTIILEELGECPRSQEHVSYRGGCSRPRGKKQAVTHLLTAQNEVGCPRENPKKGFLGYSRVMSLANSDPLREAVPGKAP